jgi:hypothetical protein
MLLYIQPSAVKLSAWGWRQVNYIIQVKRLESRIYSGSLQLRRLPPRSFTRPIGVRSARFFGKNRQQRNPYEKLPLVFWNEEYKVELFLDPAKDRFGGLYNFGTLQQVFRVFLDSEFPGMINDSHSIGGLVYPASKQLFLVNGWMFSPYVYKTLQERLVPLLPTYEVIILPNGFYTDDEQESHQEDFNIQSVCHEEKFGECEDMAIVIPGELIRANAKTLDEMRVVYTRMNAWTLSEYNEILRFYNLIGNI